MFWLISSKTTIRFQSSICLFFKRFILFILERKRERAQGTGEGAEGDGEKECQADSTMSAEPNTAPCWAQSSNSEIMTEPKSSFRHLTN